MIKLCGILHFISTALLLLQVAHAIYVPEGEAEGMCSFPCVLSYSEFNSRLAWTA